MIEVVDPTVDLVWVVMVSEVMMVGMVQGTGVAEGDMVDMEEVVVWVVQEDLEEVVVWVVPEVWVVDQGDLEEDEEGLVLDPPVVVSEEVA